MRALIWTKEVGFSYDKEIEVLQWGVGLFGKHAIIYDPTDGKVKKVPMRKVKCSVYEF